MATSARTALLTPLLKRSVVTHTTIVWRGFAAAGSSPPIPPFARIPAPTQKLVENNDCLFDDGVAPELALDFDSQHISSGEALLTWAGALAGLGVFWLFLKSTNPEGQNPAVNRQFDMVVPEPPTGEAAVAAVQEA